MNNVLKICIIIVTRLTYYNKTVGFKLYICIYYFKFFLRLTKHNTYLLFISEYPVDLNFYIHNMGNIICSFKSQ